MQAARNGLTMQSRALARTLGDYCHLRDAEPDFGPSDAIALGLLLHEAREQGASGMVAHYEKAFGAVCAALGLDGEAFSGKIDSQYRSGPENISRELSIRNLCRLRLAMTRFCDEWGGVLEGDIWGDRLAQSPLKDAMREAETWYAAERARLLEGVRVFDAALLRLLGWPTGSVSLTELRGTHGYPAEEDCLV